ncbi:oligosaccharide flippase family protein [Algibacter lectus]|uniref:O-antigen/teichoic acid export membrane protein n=1 Tax=Algibacter lectus TaxID=221126 RepID=A0A4R8MI62_9FLAO|nr:oligosaccharide flippase family protein [Algibacter lectus]MWW23653.1 oligosaccharide flippase family protein [Algibacter lectus]TDY63666.1 O-antigen/teichoic acid export membrane protein [Algibacter lectus]
MSQIKTASIISYLTIFTNIIVGIGLTPLILSSLGKSEYGLYMLVGSLIGYLALLDFGLNTTTVRFVSKYRHENNKEKEESFIATNIGIYGGIAVFICFIGLGFYFTIDYFFTNLSTDELNLFKAMYLFMLINLIWIMIRGALVGIIMAYEKFNFPKILNYFRIILRAITIIVLLKSGGKALGIVLIDTIFNLLILLIYIGFIYFKLPVKFKFSKFNKKYINKIFSYSIWIFLGVLMDQLYWRSGQTILGIKSTTEEIAVYAIGMLFISYYMTMSSAISGLFLPMATKMHINKASNLELTNLMVKVGRIQWFVISNMLFGFIFFGQKFIELWIGSGYEDSWIIAIIIMLTLTIPSIQNVGNSILEAYNLHARKIQVNTGLAIVSVIVAVFLVDYYHSIGVAIACAASVFIGQVIYNNYYFKKHIGLNLKTYTVSMFKGNIISIPLILTSTYLLSFISFGAEGWLNLGLKVLLFLIISSVSIYFVAMNSYEKGLIISMIFKVFKNKK